MTSRTALAFDIGGTKIAAAIVSENGDIDERRKVSTVTSSGPEQLIADVCKVGSELISNRDVHCIGISSAGPLAPLEGALINPTNMKTDAQSWGLVPIAGPIQKQLGLPTILENDAAAAVVGERWMGQHAGASSLLSITLGTGVGVGAIVEGRLQRLKNAYHPEVSHISLNSSDELAPCGCGNFGCIEAYLSGVNFPKYFARLKNLEPLTGKQLVEQARSGVAEYQDAFSTYSELMAQALNSLVLIYGPDHIIFSGSFSSAFPLFQENVEQRLKQLLKDRREGVDFLPSLSLSTIAETAGLLGAAKMAFSYPQREGLQ